MDEKDLLLLRLLEENSRLSPEELGIMAELSPDDVTCRVTALEEAKIIKSYTTVIDWERAANGEVAAIIELKVNPERDFGYDRIAGRLANFREVRSLRLITGVYEDITATMDCKRRALSCHASQLEFTDFLAGVEGLNRFRAVSGLTGGSYAEAFFLTPLPNYRRLYRKLLL